jgi:single-strand DNA-binding protein
MGSLNKVMPLGNLGRDPEIRYTNAGSSVANYSIATTDRWTDRQGQKQERTEWHDIVAFDRLADLSQNYLRKGSNVFIEGRLQTRSWEDNEGQKKYRTEVVANVIQFLDKGWSDNGNENQETELSDNNPLR